MMKNLLSEIILFSFLFSSLLLAQQGNVKIGTELGQYRQTQGAYYDYSDPEAVNIKVSVWGFVKFPGYYLVPGYTTTKELLSLSGGPTDAAKLEDLRLYRVLEDSTQLLFKFDYNDLLWGESLKTNKEKIPNLAVGDVLLVPGEPRLYFRETLSIVLSVVSTLISVVLLINTVKK
ncbi:MAG: SLBB domain-containing protein [Ignavibacteria bacterium]